MSRRYLELFHIFNALQENVVANSKFEEIIRPSCDVSTICCSKIARSKKESRMLFAMFVLPNKCNLHFFGPYRGLTLLVGSKLETGLFSLIFQSFFLSLVTLAKVLPTLFVYKNRYSDFFKQRATR